MKIVFALLVILCGATLYSFRSIELNLLENGYSWTISKLLPYLVLVFGGILLAITFSRGFHFRPRIVKILAVLILIAAPFGIGFALHPIYEGDFSSDGTEVTASKVKVNKKYDLLVVTIPNCPFCLESISRLKLIKKRNPDAQILFSVCSSDKEKMTLYKELIAGDFDIALAKDINASVALAEAHFPTFVLIRDGKPAYKWSNDQFGAGAIDSFEGDIK